jgi:hypothetical protein
MWCTVSSSLSGRPSASAITMRCSGTHPPRSRIGADDRPRVGRARNPSGAADRLSNGDDGQGAGRKAASRIEWDPTVVHKRWRHILHKRSGTRATCNVARRTTTDPSRQVRRACLVASEDNTSRPGRLRAKSRRIGSLRALPFAPSSPKAPTRPRRVGATNLFAGAADLSVSKVPARVPSRRRRGS